MYILFFLLFFCTPYNHFVSAQNIDTSQINTLIQQAEKDLKTDPAKANSIIDKSILEAQKSNYKNGLGLA
jgi:F0F1-type ATP synthase epsilon subunit